VCWHLAFSGFQCFDTVGWVAGRAKTEWWGAGVVICLERGADLHIAQLMSLPGHPACKKTEWWGAGVVISGARCRLAYGPADVAATHCVLLE